MTAFCSNTISIGSNTVNVVFAEMTPTNSAVICNDLTNMFSFAHSLVDVFPSSSAPGVYRLHGKDPFMYPDSAKTGITLVTSITNQTIEIASGLYNEVKNQDHPSK